jgi:hypothetical protein
MNTLAKRLGLTIHVSVLECRLRSLVREYPSAPIAKRRHFEATGRQSNWTLEDYDKKRRK